MRTWTVTHPEEWEDVCSANFVPLRVRSLGREFSASLREVSLAGGLRVTEVVSGASDVYRPQRLVASEPRDDLLVSWQRTGTGRVGQSGRCAVLTTGHAAVYDSSRPYDLSFPAPMSELVLQLPRREVGLPEGALGTALARPLTGPAVVVLGSLLSTVLTAPDTDADLADAAVSLLRSALTASGDAEAVPTGSRTALLHTMRRYVEDHLADPRLSADVLARAHHVSRRYVHQIFAEAGPPPAEHIRTRRLHRADLLLRRGEPVTVAAKRSGFPSAGTFTRAYRRQYGVLPSETRTRGKVDEAQDAL